MRGSVRKRGSTWTWYLDVDPNPLTGRRRQQTKGGFKTRKECEAALRQAIADQRGGTLAKPSQRTIASFLVDEWLPAVKPKLPPPPGPTTGPTPTPTSSQCSAEVKLQGLTPVQLNLFYAHLLEDGRRRGGGGLSPKTVRNIHVMLHRALKDAVRWGYLPRNVADAVDPPVGAPPSGRSGPPSSSAPSSSTSAPTGSTRSGCWSPPPACAAANSPGCAGSTSTSRTPGSPPAAPAGGGRLRRPGLRAEDRQGPAGAGAGPGLDPRRCCASTRPARPRRRP